MPKSDGILQGWKEIAIYVARDERTVRRWEKDRGLPVRRLPGEGRAVVYAIVAELDGWMRVAPPVVEVQTAQEERATASVPGVETVLRHYAPDAETTLPAIELSLLNQQAPGRRFPQRQLLFGVLGAALSLLLIAGAGAVYRQRAGQAAPHRSAVHKSAMPGAEDELLRATYFYEQRTPGSLGKAEELLRDVVLKDPNNAPAWSALADTYLLQREYAMTPSAQAYPQARAAAERAIGLDPNLSSAHASLAFVEFFWSWRPTVAEQEFQRAIALDGNAPLPHHWYGSMLTHQGRYHEALKQLSIAQQLQPDSVAILTTRAYALGLSGQLGIAVRMLQEVSDEDHNSPGVHQQLAALSVLRPQNLPQYVAQVRMAALLRHDTAAVQESARMEKAYRTGGEKSLWQQQLADEQHTYGAAPTYRTAELKAISGRGDEALDDLDRLYRQHDWGLIGLDIDPFFFDMHQDPRFRQLVAEVGLPLMPAP